MRRREKMRRRKKQMEISGKYGLAGAIVVDVVLLIIFRVICGWRLDEIYILGAVLLVLLWLICSEIVLWVREFMLWAKNQGR